MRGTRPTHSTPILPGSSNAGGGLVSRLYQRLRPSVGFTRQRSGSAQIMKRQPSGEMAEPPAWPARLAVGIVTAGQPCGAWCSQIRALDAHAYMHACMQPALSHRVRAWAADALLVPALDGIPAAQAKGLVQVPDGARSQWLVSVLVKVHRAAAAGRAGQGGRARGGAGAAQAGCACMHAGASARTGSRLGSWSARSAGSSRARRARR